jgi:tyrosine-protein kinase Etk/Wzc
VAEEIRLKQQETSLYEVIDLLWRRRTVILVCLAGVLLPIIIANVTLPPVYESQTTIIFEQSREPIASFDVSDAFSRKSYIVNQIEEIKARTLAEDVASQLDEQTAAELLNDSHHELSPRQRQDLLAQRVKKGITAEPIRDSDVILIKFQGPTPRSSSLVVNLVAQAVRNRSAQVKREQALSTRKFIEDQMPAVEASLSRAEEAIKSFKAGNRVVSLSDEAREVMARLTEIDKLYAATVTQKIGLEKRLEAIYAKLDYRLETNSGPSRLTAGAVADSLRKRLLDLQMEATQLSIKGYPPEHPQIATLNRRIDVTKAKLSEELYNITRDNRPEPMPEMSSLLAQIPPLQIELISIEARERGIRQFIDSYEASLAKLPYKELELTRLLRAKDVNENIYKMLLEKFEEAKITEAGKIGNVRVIDPAKEPLRPIKPRKALNLLIGLVVGLVLGVGLSFFLDSLDNSVKTAEEIENTYGIPVLGLIPNIQDQAGRGHRKNGEDEIMRISSTLVTKYTPRSPVSEAYRAIRTNIQFSKIDAPLKSLVVTSAAPSEGKSTTAANLAFTTAMAGARTLLIDADLRRPVVHSLFGLEREPGMTNILVERLPLEQVIKPSGVENLDILTCGAIPPNPSELLGSQRMRALVAQLKGRYDLVIFDSPPAITVTDTAVLSSQVEGVVMVILSHGTDRRALARAKNLLTNVGANILGAILNRIDLSGIGSSYDYYYHYHYYYYSDEDPKSGKRRRLWDLLMNRKRKER